MDPDRALQGKLSEGSHPLGQNATKSFLDNAPNEEIREKEDQKTSDQGIIKKVNHNP